MSKPISSWFGVAALVAVGTLSARPAHAEPVSPTGKGITGGALLGGEVVMMAEAAFGVKSGWAYLIGGSVGAIGGGVGGYFLEQNASSAKLPMYLLTGGMALVIPTTVIVLSASAYQPPENYIEDRPPADEPIADPPQPAGAAPGADEGQPAHKARRLAQRSSHPGPGSPTRRPARYPAPTVTPALVGWGVEGLSLSVPSIEVRNVFTRAESAELGVPQYTEWRLPVVSWLF